MYSLKYEMMIQVLQQLSYSGELQANIPSQAALREGGLVVLLVQKGKVTSCLIFDKNGHKLHDDAQAQRRLLKLGIVDWHLVSSTRSQTASPVPLSTAPEAIPAQREQDLIPQRLPGYQTQMPTWSILERSVFSLADGTRTIEQIATLLSRPIQTIVEVIYKLAKSGAITWHRH
jgi:hypothetical protein